MLIVALDVVRAQHSRVQETHEERNAGIEKTDVAVTLPAIPMLAGPGTISTVILLQNEAKNIPRRIALYGASWRCWRLSDFADLRAWRGG